MKTRKKAGLAQFIKATAPKAARRLFAKARLAGDVAYAALDRRSGDIAREVKIQLLEAALRVDPAVCRRYPDRRVGRWIHCSLHDGSLHGRALDDGL